VIQNKKHKAIGECADDNMP